MARSGLLGERIYAPAPFDEPHSLCQLIADSDLKSAMLIPNPEFSRIVIHRLKDDSGGEEDIAVNLVDLLTRMEKLTERPPQEEIRAKADVPLQWGDIVEIPSNRLKEENVWTGINGTLGLSMESVLWRGAELVLADTERFSDRESVRFRPFEWKTNAWELNTHAGEASTDLDDHLSLKRLLERYQVDLEKVQRLDIHSPNGVRQISIDDLKKYEPRFRDGDVIVPVLR